MERTNSVAALFPGFSSEPAVYAPGGEVEVVAVLPLCPYPAIQARGWNRFQRVFPGGEGDGGDIFDIQQRIVDEMASGDVTKKEKVKQSLLYDALYTLEMAIERDEKARQNKMI